MSILHSGELGWNGGSAERQGILNPSICVFSRFPTKRVGGLRKEKGGKEIGMSASGKKEAVNKDVAKMFGGIIRDVGWRGGAGKEQIRRRSPKPDPR